MAAPLWQAVAPPMIEEHEDLAVALQKLEWYAGDGWATMRESRGSGSDLE